MGNLLLAIMVFLCGVWTVRTSGDAWVERLIGIVVCCVSAVVILNAVLW